MSKNATNHRAYINIKCEVDKHGKVTKEAMRFYCESRLSKKEFNNAVNVGKSAFDKRINKTCDVCNGHHNNIVPCPKCGMIKDLIDG